MEVLKVEKELVVKSDIEINECISDQVQLCKEKDYPHFAPKSGRCWKCNRIIYQNYIIDGRVRNGETGKEFVTGCPHCHSSYCD